MQITEKSSVREVLRRYPATRTVFERHGLMGCGGAQGPDEPIELFARAHGGDTERLLRELQAAAQTTHASGAPQPEAVEAESYRYYLRAAVLIGVLAGAGLGAVNLTWIAIWGFTGEMPRWDWWPALIQAHGNAQLFGWTGLFVIGIASHSLPRMLQRPAPSPGLAGAIWALILSGLTLGLVAQPLAAQAGFARLFVISAALQWLGVTLFGGYVLATLRRPREPWAGFLLAGTLWFWLGATGRLWLSAFAVAAGNLTPPAAGNAAYLHLMTWGFLLSYVLGYNLRLLPAFLGLPASRPRPAWAALLFLTLGAAVEVPARLANLADLSAGATAMTLLGLACFVVALPLWSPKLSSGDAEAAWLARFVHTAYAWLAVAAVVLIGLRIGEALRPVSLLHAHAFGGASRHAFTVGFVSLMIVGLAWRILPIFSGAPRTHPALVPVVYGLLFTGNTLRVGGQMAAGLWGGSWYAVMGASGWLELAAVSLFAADVLRLLKRTPERGALPDAGAPVELSINAPVGPLVAHRPWLIPVFARHGLGQVSNPIFQRTVGQRVTLAQACQRFNLDPERFLAELQAADVDQQQCAGEEDRVSGDPDAVGTRCGVRPDERAEHPLIQISTGNGHTPPPARNPGR
ncbi:MAG: DUF1858 domain-containing protein [Armatimonadetes bacterium]|nr:DUF1858 domain-containing protein [Armatimonadota bacterium]